MHSIVALKPMVQRQNNAARSEAVPRSTICSNLAFATEPADRQDGRPVHRKQQRRSIEKRNRKRVERVVEQVAVRDRKQVGPVKVREDAVGNRLGPRPHQDRPDRS